MEAPGEITAFGIEIVSPLLDDETLGLAGLSTKMDLADPTPSQIAGFEQLGFPYGTAVKGQTVLDFDLSGVMPLLRMLCEANDEASDHRFVLTVVDQARQSVSATLKLHYEPGTALPSVAYAGDADLWANTATLTAANLPAEAVVQYCAKGMEAWNDATAVGDGKFRIAPVWEEGRNDAKLTVRTVKAGTGVFAASTYEFRAVAGGEVLASGEFATAPGDAIPNGDMAGWSGKEYQGDESSWDLTYPNPAGQRFWDSGNNPFLENPEIENAAGPLCCENPEEKGTALLQGRMALGIVFAPGNLFVGDFVFAGMGGTVSFGKVYGWTARPRALKLRYKAQVGTIDQAGANDPEGADRKGQQDRSQIFVAVVDWTKQHEVVSGMQAPTGMWNPATMTSVEEGPILAYGERIIAESTDGWVECTIPLYWYADAGAKPAPENYSLVISCATSIRGDYLTGCSTNTMCVDDFGWVY
ncbi:PCMD domain-containing protein [uncultured Alistipes sp.]|uniref:PCMD domain-containing protein n=1 Tax=uncultured Alistipes sp. TaxID=538949 RepID=UPI00266EFB8F|nr:PCMD domain-containing protein [uncultured Alistipes sp.]